MARKPFFARAVESGFLTHGHVEELKRLVLGGGSAELSNFSDARFWETSRDDPEGLSKKKFGELFSLFHHLDDLGFVKAKWDVDATSRIWLRKKKGFRIMRELVKYDSWLKRGKSNAGKVRKRWLKNPLVSAVRNEALTHEHVEALRRLLRSGGEVKLLAKGSKFIWADGSENRAITKSELLKHADLFYNLHKLGFVVLSTSSGDKYAEEHEIVIPRKKVSKLLSHLGVYDEWRASRQRTGKTK